MIITVDENNDAVRLDVYLAELYEGISRSKVQSAIKSGKVTVNSEIKKPSYVLKQNDKIEFETLIDKSEITLEPQNIPLEIVWEDENMAVVNKPSGMLTHPTYIETSDTLVNALLYKYGENLSDMNGEFRRGIVHRLDRNTSGLLMIAKNNKTHEYLANLIKNHELTKKYRAVLVGNYPRENDVITEPIGRNNVNPKKMAVRPDGKPSVTKLKVLEHFGNEATYVELDLITGRTHQIRVHTSYKHHPVYNDTLYGAGTGKLKTQEQVLQSYYLKFAKPFSSQIIELEIKPDEKLEKTLNYLKTGEFNMKRIFIFLSFLILLASMYLILLNTNVNIDMHWAYSKLLQAQTEAGLTDAGAYFKIKTSLSTIIMCFLAAGIFVGAGTVYMFLSASKEKIKAYKRELEKVSISGDSNSSKVQVLEAKLKTMEKALSSVVDERKQLEIQIQQLKNDLNGLNNK